MAAALDDFPRVDDHDDVGSPNGAQPVRNDEAGAAAH